MNKTATLATGALLAMSFLVPALASAQTATLAATCAGVASTTSITWTAATTGGVAPVALLWGNGATTSPITVAETPGTYTMTLQATDASSTVATTTCQATVASSTTSTGGTSILAQIQALLAQINALKQQIAQLIGSAASGTGSSTPMFSGCPVPTRNLGLGDRGDDVKEIQLFLASTSPDQFSASNATGFFGPLTLKAMKHFQEENDIASSSTGTVGPLTRGFFGRHCGLIEGEGHLKGTAKSPFDLTASSTFKIHGNSGDHGHNGSSSEDDNASSTDH